MTKFPRRREILIVDDNPTNLNVLTGMLEGDDYIIRATVSGELALAAVKTSPPDLVLLDILMPRMDGYEVCRLLKSDEATRHIPIIFISALDTPFDKVKAFNVGGVDFVTKPFQQEEVLARVDTHLSIAELQRELERKSAQLQKRDRQVKKFQKITRGFLSGENWEEILATVSSPESMREPEIQTLTFLRIGLEGLTKMLKAPDPGSVLQDLNRYKEILIRSVHESEGDVERDFGDGILAVFNHPKDALFAACQIQKQLDDFNNDQIGSQKLNFRIKIGLATGETFLTPIDSHHLRPYTRISDCISVSEHLQKYASRGEIVMDEDTFLGIGSGLQIFTERSEMEICFQEKAIYHFSGCPELV